MLVRSGLLLWPCSEVRTAASAILVRSGLLLQSY
uniref:Uncharacterized protein n=1 Tax=Anguilla anguilla TaxID=7936 RepID=A0A0E9PDS1_ANGAN